KRSQTQCVSPRGPPPLAGHTLPVDQKDRGREGESGRVGEGHKDNAILSVCLHGESRSGRGTQREAELSVCQPQGPGRGWGRRGGWERERERGGEREREGERERGKIIKQRSIKTCVE